MKQQLETALEQLRQRLLEAEEQLASLQTAHLHGQVGAAAVQQNEERVLELRREIQRRKISVSDVAERIAAAESDERQDRVRQLSQANDAAKSELDLLRRELLRSLLGMADLLRRHQGQVEEKLRVSRDLAIITGRDFAYENYISCAVLHQADYTGDVQFVVDAVKKMRPVA